jgi:hypothetical protein
MDQWRWQREVSRDRVRKQTLKGLIPTAEWMGEMSVNIYRTTWYHTSENIFFILIAVEDLRIAACLFLRRLRMARFLQQSTRRMVW